MSRWCVLVLVGAVCSLTAAEPKRLGATFSIGEVDLWEWIGQRLRVLEHDGTLAQWQQTQRDRIRDQFEQPMPVSLSATQSPTTFLVDPSVRLPATYDGQPPGRWVNPFDASTWPSPPLGMAYHYPRALVFFDGRDRKQRRWATQFTADRPITWILTGGRPQTLARTLNAPVYFDQGGYLSRKLRLRSVPSVVVQAHRYWEVTEHDVSFWENQP